MNDHRKCISCNTITACGIPVISTVMLGLLLGCADPINVADVAGTSEAINTMPYMGSCAAASCPTACLITSVGIGLDVARVQSKEARKLNVA